MDRLTIKINDDDNIALCKGQVCAPNPCYQIQTDTMTGNCADCPAWGEIINRLAAYEDLNATPEECKAALELARKKEEGLIVELPCKSGDTIFHLTSKKHARGKTILPRIVSCVTVWSDGNYEVNHQGQVPCLKSGLSKTWFLTREEADQAAAANGREME